VETATPDVSKGMNEAQMLIRILDHLEKEKLTIESRFEELGRQCKCCPQHSASVLAAVADARKYAPTPLEVEAPPPLVTALGNQAVRPRMQYDAKRELPELARLEYGPSADAGNSRPTYAPRHRTGDGSDVYLPQLRDARSEPSGAPAMQPYGRFHIDSDDYIQARTRIPEDQPRHESPHRSPTLGPLMAKPASRMFRLDASQAAIRRDG
jgi:hypothetical protein